VNVALRLISLCPPAFQPVHSAPRTQTVKPTASNPIASSHVVAPLFSWPYELLFPQTLYIQKHLRCPPGVPPQTVFPKDNYVDLPTTPAYPLHYQAIAHSCSLLQLFFALPSFVFNGLRTLLQKQGGGHPLQPEPRKQKGPRRSLILRAARGMAPCVRMRLSGGGYSTRSSMPAPLVSFSWPLAEVRTMTPSGSVFPVWAM
jgi:hypothetical protein